METKHTTEYQNIINIHVISHLNVTSHLKYACLSDKNGRITRHILCPQKGVDMFAVAFKLIEYTFDCKSGTTVYFVARCATQVFPFSLFKFIKSCLCFDGAEGFRLVWG